MSTITNFGDRIKTNLKSALMSVNKAGLASDSGSGAGAIPYHLSNAIVNGIRYINPIMNLFQMEPMRKTGENASNVYRYPLVSALRQSGNYGGEKSNPSPNTPTVIQKSVNLKVSKTKMQIYDFYKDVTAGYLDAISFAILQESRAWGLDFLIRAIYDNSYALYDASDLSIGAWERSFDVSLQERRLQKFTSGLPTALTTAMVDEAIRLSNIAQGGLNTPKNRVLLMSPALAIKLNDLQTVGSLGLIRYNLPVPTVAPTQDNPYRLDAGTYISNYKGVPIVECQGFGGETAGTMGAITTSSVAGSSGLSSQNYYIKVSKVVATTDPNVSNNSIGETMCGAATVTAVTATNTLRVTIASPDANAYYYKVYMSTSATDVAANYRLVGVYRGKTLDSAGNIVASATQGGVTSNASGYTITLDVNYDTTATDAQLLTQGVYGSMKNDLPLTLSSGGANGECFALIDLDAVQGAGGYVYVQNSTPDQDAGFMSVIPLAKTSDSDQFQLISYGTPIMRYTSSSVLVRGVSAY